MISSEHLADLRSAAEQATPGPWENWGAPSGRIGGGEIIGNNLKSLVGNLHSRKDRLYVRLIDPTTLLELLDEIERYRGRVAHDNYKVLNHVLDFIRAQEGEFHARDIPRGEFTGKMILNRLTYLRRRGDIVRLGHGLYVRASK